MSTCYRCLAPVTSVSVCLDCRFKFDAVERDLATARRDLAWLRKENRNLRSAVRRRVRPRLRKRP